ncbi:hypothetical protein METH_16005 [Leisingera methylohalidivorans DSM 14336]|uniref:Uncharacterized protein n=1 Tax=Leisingera methylohalidivorans DSM 14336 TaxID=999552 RepID=V9VZG3_9RHOB|nr:hypothetical protein METH_16005 [Leisingera methylohalidivorans DSM 14336]
MTDIALRIVSKKVENIEAQLIGYFTSNDRSMASFWVSLETEQARGRSADGILQILKRVLRGICFDMVAIDRAEEIKFASSGRFPTRFWISKCDEMNIFNAFFGEALGKLFLGETGFA